MLTWPSGCWTYLACVLRASAIVKHLCASFDTILIPPGTQYGATQGKPVQRKPFRYAEIARLCKPLQRLTAHS